MKSAFFPAHAGASGAASPDQGPVRSSTAGSAAGAADVERPRSGGAAGLGAAAGWAGAGGGATKHVSAYATGARGLRFPSSRRYLWDRTPAGAQVLIGAQDLVPHTSIAASALSAIADALSGSSSSGAGGVALRASFATTSTFQLTALLQAADVGAAGGGGAAPQSGETAKLVCALAAGPAQHEEAGVGGGGSRDNRQQEQHVADAEALQAAGGDDEALAALLCVRLDTQGPARVAELFALSLCAVPASRGRAKPALLGRLALPAIGLLITPLFAKRLCAAPLAEALLRPGRVAPGCSGYLSMDQARSLLPIGADDDNVHTTPLVGVWVKGPDSPLHPLVAAACIKFFYSSTLLDRALQEDGSFLLLLCPEGQPVSRCYEVRPTEPQRLPLATYSLAADLEPTLQLERHPSGLIPLGWAPDALCPPPLALPPAPPAAGGGAGAGTQGQWLGAAGGDQGVRRSVHAAGGTGTLPPRPYSGPGSAPWSGGGAGASGAGSPVTPHAHVQPRQPAAAAWAQEAAACGRPASSGGRAGPYGGVTAGAAGADDAEPRPRPSPWGLRPYGSADGGGGGGAGGDAPPPPSPGDLDEEQWATGDAGEDAARGDGVRLGSPVRVERAAAGEGRDLGATHGPGANAPAVGPGAQAGSLALKLDTAAAASHASLPVLLGGPYSPSPRHMVHDASSPFTLSPGRPRDTLRDSLDTGRRAISAAATAIANAEAAVLRGSGGGAAGGGIGGASVVVGMGGAGAAGARASDPLRWSLQQSAHAVGGLAAALDAAASALSGPDAGAAAAGPARSPGRGALQAGQHRVIVLPSHDAWTDSHASPGPHSGAPSPALSPWAAGSPHHGWSPHNQQVQHLQQQQAVAARPAAGAPAMPPSVVAVASWSPPPQDVSTRELQDEVVRLRAELAQLHDLLEAATRLPPASDHLGAACTAHLPSASSALAQASEAPPPGLDQQQQHFQQQHFQQQQQQQQQLPPASQHGPQHPSAGPSSSPGRDMRRSRLSQSSGGVDPCGALVDRPAAQPPQHHAGPVPGSSKEREAAAARPPSGGHRAAQPQSPAASARPSQRGSPQHPAMVFVGQGSDGGSPSSTAQPPAVPPAAAPAQSAEAGAPLTAAAEKLATTAAAANNERGAQQQAGMADPAATHMQASSMPGTQPVGAAATSARAPAEVAGAVVKAAAEEAGGASATAGAPASEGSSVPPPAPGGASPAKAKTAAQCKAAGSASAAAAAAAVAAAAATAAARYSVDGPVGRGAGAHRQRRRGRRALDDAGCSSASGSSSEGSDLEAGCSDGEHGADDQLRSPSVMEVVAGVAALFPGRAAAAAAQATSAGTPSSRPGTARAGVGGASVRGSHSTIRSSVAALSPAAPVLRTQYTPLSSGEDTDDDEEEARLMKKYGLAR